MIRNRRKITARVSLILAIVMLLSLTGCIGGYRVGGKALELLEVEDRKYSEKVYENVMAVFREGNVANLNSMSHSSKVTYEAAWETWESMVETYGAYQEYSVDSAYYYGDDTIVIGYVTLENGRIAIDVKMDDYGELKQVEVYVPGEEEEASYTMPDAIEEQEVVVGEGTDYPLNGIITMPKGAGENGETYPAVVLIHGTGAGDMNMTGGNTRMLRDIAWGLAEQGIISIRYDKRTSQYSEELELHPTAENLTVDWEIIDDALLATEILHGLDAVDSEQVYAAGHSLGGLVMPRIDENGGNYAGYIMMAVPDSTWQQAAFDQYLNYGLANIDSDDVYYACSFLESQKKDIDKKLDTYSAEELLQENLLGMPAQYWMSLNSMDYISYYENTDKPMLLIQGDADYQILPEDNYEGWQKKLEGHENVTMVLYEGLNHLMMKSQGCFMGCSMEYHMPNHVDEAVISDMAAFINK